MVGTLTADLWISTTFRRGMHRALLVLGRITCKKLARALQIARATLALLRFLDPHPWPDSTACLSNTHPTGT